MKADFSHVITRPRSWGFKKPTKHGETRDFKKNKTMCCNPLGAGCGDGVLCVVGSSSPETVKLITVGLLKTKSTMDF